MDHVSREHLQIIMLIFDEGLLLHVLFRHDCGGASDGNAVAPHPKVCQDFLEFLADPCAREQAPLPDVVAFEHGKPTETVDVLLLNYRRQIVVHHAQQPVRDSLLEW